MVKVGDYNLGELVGHGTFSQVKLAVHMKTGQRFVAKIVPREQSGSMGQDVRKEIFILRKVRHENVVSLHEILVSENNYYIILEPVLGGDLCTLLLRKFPDGMPRLEVQRLFTQLVSGLAQCHGVGVAHRDLKPENLLITEANQLKISDFGVSRLHRHSQHEARPNELAETVAGTLAYCSPDVLSGRPYDAFKADMWSVGCILYTMVTGHFPFGSAAGFALEKRILDSTYDPLPLHVAADVRELIAGLLTKDPDRRLTLPQVAAHPFVAGETPSDDLDQYTFVTEEASPKAGPERITAEQQALIAQEVLRPVDVDGGFDIHPLGLTSSLSHNGGQTSAILQRLQLLAEDSDEAPTSEEEEEEE